ncbi:MULTISPECIES: hypothetical protein [unclassified Frigoribacterium]|jgi:hypothetical protein|uniref:hypothetical protein n=1 Tax=unclassified Frigoribacterium TaxID=2627005 RepID=UPI0017815273|nr:MULTISPECIES: hypothetical protein [unclassified Frigoribacterium]MBD8140497.1 hypothetical protein [Frigoribacterium sp. CFBP 13605]MBD8540221.1 hypothetical protein [Frigoribacterium sp. CFBP 8751]
MRLRLGLIGAVVGVLEVVGFAIVSATTDLSGFTGIGIGIVTIVVFGGQAIWAFVQPRHLDNS